MRVILIILAVVLAAMDIEIKIADLKRTMTATHSCAQP